MTGRTITYEDKCQIARQAQQVYDEAADESERLQAMELMTAVRRIPAGTILSDGRPDCPIRLQNERARAEADARRIEACRASLLRYLGLADADPNYGEPVPAGGIGCGRTYAWLPEREREPRIVIGSPEAKRLATVIETCERRLLFNTMVLAFMFRLQRAKLGGRIGFDPSAVTPAERGECMRASYSWLSWISYHGAFPLWLGGPTEQEQRTYGP